MLGMFSMAAYSGYESFKPTKNNMHDNSVMITNRSMNHGGTGIVLKSEAHKSQVLTNDHVCKVVKEGGVVITSKGVFQVNSIKESQQSDLCMLTVLDDLKTNTTVSVKAPSLYDNVTVSGHPALMPNIQSKGHLSGRTIIPVMMGFRPCTDADLDGPDSLYCAFFGGVPLVRFFESVLVSATIMPGSSGSGVYNSSNELIGVVFAGQGDFGYGWTVPYEQVKNFLNVESNSLNDQLIDQSLVVNSKSSEEHRNLVVKCAKERFTDPKINEVCSLISRDMVFRN